MKNLIKQFGLWLAKLAGHVEDKAKAELDVFEHFGLKEYEAAGRMIVSQTAKLQGSSEYLRSEALRALENIFTNAKKSKLGLLIELLVQ